MKIYSQAQSRDEYLAAQVQRSNAKFDYCKVSARDVQRYADLLALRQQRSGLRQEIGPVLCLGTRNGREVDLFRIHLFGAPWLRRLTAWCETSHRSFRSRLPFIEGVGRSRTDALGDRSVIGVELNPKGGRSDVWVGSFDAMPEAWTDRFGLVYSNSFDQSQDPERSAAEWRRVVRPGGYLLCCFTNNAEPTSTDPVGGLSLADVQALFGGELVYFRDRGSRAGYSEALMRFEKGTR